MVLLDKNSEPQPIYDFEATVIIIQQATTIKPNYQAVVHCGVIRQAAKVLDCENASMRVNDNGVIKFRFMYRPEFIKEGSTILFREGRTKGFGVITKVYLPNKGQNPNLPVGGGRKQQHSQHQKKPGAKYQQQNTANQSAAASSTTKK